MKRVILHIDMDAFYASVEQLLNPDLKGKPVIVGGSSNRGVVSTASYEARAFGVHSAMPIFQAKKKCPHGFFLPVRMGYYQEYSNRVMSILADFSPQIEPVSIDEAYLDLTGFERLFGSPKEAGEKIKSRIKKELGLSCSIGIAPNKFLSKIASDMHKPDGLTMIVESDVLAFIQKLPIRKVTGVGEKTLSILEKLGIRHLSDVAGVSPYRLEEHLGKFSRRLMELCRGEDDSAVIPYTDPKSVSSEDTFARDTGDKCFLKKQLLIQSEIVGKRLRESGFQGKTVTLKLKTGDFKLINRSITLNQATDSAQTVYEQGLVLLEKTLKSMAYRLIGIGVSHLVRKDARLHQASLFIETQEKEKHWNEVEKAMDLIQDRFGRDAIRRACLLKSKGPSTG